MSSISSPAADNGAAQAGRLYEAYSEPLLGYCLRHLRCPVDAEDAVQTTFLYATRALRRGVVPECESAWLHAIAKNVCHWQRRSTSRRRSVPSDPLERLIAEEPVPEDDNELAFEVREALARIPERQRRALVMREIQGAPAREVASALGLGPCETYALLSRARRSFARAFEVVTGRPALGLHLAPLLLKVKATVTGGAATVVAATSIVVGVTVGLGGASTERRSQPTPAAAERSSPSHVGDSSAPPPPVPASGQPTTRDIVRLAPARASGSGSRARAGTPPTNAPVDAPRTRPASTDGDPAPGERASEPAPGVPEEPLPLPEAELPVPLPDELVPLPDLQTDVEVGAADLPVDPADVDGSDALDSLVPGVPLPPLP